MRYQGKITNWKDDQGFGFITPNGGGKQVFVHIKSFSNRQRRPLVNEIVTYELKKDSKGRMYAENVAYVGDRKYTENSSIVGRAIPFLTVVFLIVLVGLVFLGKLPSAVLKIYLIASIITFGVYGLDKYFAKKGKWRTQESTLHLLALVGGWPGALAAQRILRHKSKKQSFQNVFLITVVLNCGVLCWLLTTSDSKALYSFLGFL
jgi:uncharacterized membrane protein YsdA (DUF1294 family)/cold shock CspA family protein